MVRHNSPLSKGKLLPVTSFQRAQYGKGGVEKRNFTVEKSGRQQLNQVIKLLLSAIKQNPVPPTHNITTVMPPPQMSDLSHEEQETSPN